MASITRELAELVIAAIDDRLNNVLPWPTGSRWEGQSGFVHTGFPTEFTWFPFNKLVELGPSGSLRDGKLFVVGQASTNAVLESRKTAMRLEVPVALGFQKLVNNIHDNDEIDKYAELVDQLLEVCRTEIDNTRRAQFTRVEFLTDDGGTPMQYTGLREEHSFEAYFSVFFHYFL